MSVSPIKRQYFKQLVYQQYECLFMASRDMVSLQYVEMWACFGHIDWNVRELP